MRKQVIITFKVDANLMDLLKNIPNRSEFIRNAIVSAVEKTCPLCSGTGILKPDKKQN